MRGTYEFDYTFGYPPVVNDKEFNEEFVKYAKEIILGEDILVMKKPAMGGEEIVYYLQRVPGTFFFLITQRQ